MSNQAQIDALEHLLMAVLRSSPMTMNSFTAFETAHSALLKSEGPGGPIDRSASIDYLLQLKKKL